MLMATTSALPPLAFVAPATEPVATAEMFAAPVLEPIEEETHMRVDEFSRDFGNQYLAMTSSWAFGEPAASDSPQVQAAMEYYLAPNQIDPGLIKDIPEAFEPVPEPVIATTGREPAGWALGALVALKFLFGV